MKTEFKMPDDTKAKEYVMSLLIFGDFAVTLIAGGLLINVLTLPETVIPYVGGAILGYGVIRMLVTINKSVKSEKGK